MLIYFTKYYYICSKTLDILKKLVYHYYIRKKHKYITKLQQRYNDR